MKVLKDAIIAFLFEFWVSLGSFGLSTVVFGDPWGAFERPLWLHFSPLGIHWGAFGESLGSMCLLWGSIGRLWGVKHRTEERDLESNVICQAQYNSHNHLNNREHPQPLWLKSLSRGYHLHSFVFSKGAFGLFIFASVMLNSFTGWPASRLMYLTRAPATNCKCEDTLRTQ